MKSKTLKSLCVLSLALLASSVQPAFGAAEVDWTYDTGFSPSQLTISPGDSVVWWNLDPYGATVTISVTGLSPFILAPYQGAQASFPTAGTYYMSSDWGDTGVLTVSSGGGGGTTVSISITNPVNNAVLPANTPFEIQVAASAPTGVQFVEFWTEDQSDFTYSLVGDDYTAPYSATTNLAEGSYNLHAYLYDNNSAFLMEDVISITVVAAQATPIELENPRHAGGQFLFDVSGLAVGKSNILEYCTDLSTGTWLPVVTNTATSTNASFTNAVSAGPRFYRIHQLP